MNLGLEGKVGIVTGGASGIGSAIVAGFIKEGASIVMADINLDAAQKLSEKLGKSGVKVLAVRTDVTKKPDVDNLVSTAIKEFGKIDILINNAGVCRDIKFIDIKEDEWDRVNNVNLKGVYMVTRTVLPHMITAKYGKIVNTSSIGGKEGYIGFSHYCATKFGILGLTQALAKELAEYDINVNAVCPGIVRTDMWEGILDDLAEREGRPREEIFREWINSVPLKRKVDPEDMANVVLFLSSEASRNITGEAISVNGGMRMD